MLSPSLPFHSSFFSLRIPKPWFFSGLCAYVPVSFGNAMISFRIMSACLEAFFYKVVFRAFFHSSIPGVAYSFLEKILRISYY